MALPLLPIALGTQAIGGIAQLFGAGRRRRAARQAEQRIRGNLQGLETYAREGLPEAEYQQALQNIQRGRSTALRALRSSGGGQVLRGISQLVDASNDATLALDVQDALARRQNQIYAYQQQQQFEQQQYGEESQAAQALTGAGFQNIFGALSGAAASGIQNGDLRLFNRGSRTPIGMIGSRLQRVGATPINNSIQVQPSF